MLESFSIKVELFEEPNNSIGNYQVQIWSNMIHKHNPEGVWKESAMTELFREKEGQETKVVWIWDGLLTSPGLFEFTIRIIFFNAYGSGKNKIFWLGQPGVNGKVLVHPPDLNNPSLRWTVGPQAVNVDRERLWVGNFIMASRADEFGFDTVLNVAEELDLHLPSHILYKKIPCVDGAHNPLRREAIKEAVLFIDKCVTEDRKKILVHCRAGIGRSGSMAVAYVFYKHENWSYELALNFVWISKPEIYPHARLAETLHSLFPRKSPPQ
eukprot:TRINITY_DN5706_c0_g1_i3.p1 TRINITY_DN5706_c0_g1~~TRINITY_DN5706_c0_g1_i3.p1  ORF type:complete len:268 (+),score=55.38 TRINITY_DN5706_c0_g1_i3:63-866(+)